MGLGPLLRPGEPSQAPSWEARGKNGGAEGTPQNQEPSQQCPHHRAWGRSRGRVRRGGKSALSGRASVRVGEGSLETETEGNCSPLGPWGPAAAGVLCSVAVRAQVGGGDAWAWGGRRERSGAVQSQKEAAPRQGSRRHGAVTAPPRRTPARCPLLPPSPGRGAGRSAAVPGLRPSPHCGGGAQATMAPTPPRAPWLSRRGMSQG